MKKRFTLVAAFALALSVQAQHQPRPAVQPHELNRALRAPKSLYAPQPRQLAGEMPYDTLLVTGMSKREYASSDVEQTQTDSAYVIYDNCGRRKFLVTRDEVTRYTYETGPYNIWTLRIIETASWSGQNMVPSEAELNSLNYTGKSKEERVINDDKQMLSNTIYTFSNGEWKLAERNRYDYSHVFDDKGKKRVGHLVESYVVDDDGACEDIYQWFEPARKYVVVSSKNAYSKEEAVFGTDSYTIKIYVSPMRDGNYVLDEERTYYFTEGCEVGLLNTRYDSDGNVGERYGYRHFYAPIADGFALTYQEWNDQKNDWEAKAKSECRNCTIEDVKIGEEESRALKKGRSGTIDLYKYDSEGQPYLSEKCVAVSLSSRLWKQQVEYVAYGEKEELLLFLMDADAEGYLDEERWEKAAMAPDGSYVVQYDDNFYDFYSSDHQFLHKVKKENTKWALPENANVELSFPSFYEQQGDEWKQMRDVSIAEFENSNYSNNRVAYSYDEQGRPISQIVYLYDEQGNEEMQEKCLYEYSANGYKESRYNLDLIGGKWQFVLYASVANSLLADGTVRYEQFSYSGNEYIEYGMRTDTQPNGLRLSYYYDSSKKDFVQSSRTVADIREILPDGTEVTTQYNFGDDGKTPVQNSKSEKRITKKGYLTERMEAYYKWDNDNKRWRGSSKFVECSVNIPKFYQNTTVDPIEEYDDDFGPEDGKRFGYTDISEQVTTFAEWNESKQAWDEMIDEPMTIDRPDERTCILTHKKMEGTKLRTIKWTYAVDSQKLLLKEWKEITVQSAEGEVWTEFDKKDYTYNDNGYLQSSTSKWGTNKAANTTLLNYYYTLTSILPTAIEQAKADEAGIRVVNGQILAANPNEVLRLYSLDGKQVATGRGTVLPPAKGIYVVRSAKGGCKVLVK